MGSRLGVRLPDWAWRRLERAYFDQRAIRQRELRAEVERQDRILRQWGMWARFAHQHRQCLRPNGPCHFAGH